MFGPLTWSTSLVDFNQFFVKLNFIVIRKWRDSFLCFLAYNFVTSDRHLWMWKLFSKTTLQDEWRHQVSNRLSDWKIIEFELLRVSITRTLYISSKPTHIRKKLFHSFQIWFVTNWQKLKRFKWCPPKITKNCNISYNLFENTNCYLDYDQNICTQLTYYNKLYYARTYRTY
jgi:hypothetical protein